MSSSSGGLACNLCPCRRETKSRSTSVGRVPGAEREPLRFEARDKVGDGWIPDPESRREQRGNSFVRASNYFSKQVSPRAISMALIAAEEPHAGAELTCKARQALGGGPRNPSGSTGAPSCRTSKCRWGPLVFPDSPTVAMTCPSRTVCPVFTRRSRLCA